MSAIPVKQGDLAKPGENESELQLKDAQARMKHQKAQLKGTELKKYANKIELAKLR
jgi:hypothetical protein